MYSKSKVKLTLTIIWSLVFSGNSQFVAEVLEALWHQSRDAFTLVPSTLHPITPVSHPDELLSGQTSPGFIWWRPPSTGHIRQDMWESNCKLHIPTTGPSTTVSRALKRQAKFLHLLNRWAKLTSWQAPPPPAAQLMCFCLCWWDWSSSQCSSCKTIDLPGDLSIICSLILELFLKLSFPRAGLIPADSRSRPPPSSSLLISWRCGRLGQVGPGGRSVSISECEVTLPRRCWWTVAPPMRHGHLSRPSLLNTSDTHMLHSGAGGQRSMCDWRVSSLNVSDTRNLYWVWEETHRSVWWWKHGDVVQWN